MRPEAEVLENMRLAFFDDLVAPVDEEPELPQYVQMGSARPEVTQTRKPRPAKTLSEPVAVKPVACSTGKESTVAGFYTSCPRFGALWPARHTSPGPPAACRVGGTGAMATGQGRRSVKRLEMRQRVKNTKAAPRTLRSLRVSRSFVNFFVPSRSRRPVW